MSSKFEWSTFQKEFKRFPSAKHDGLAVWLKNEIEYLETMDRTLFGDGALSAYKSALKELESCDG